MSWHLSITGRSSKLAEIVKDKFVTTGGCPQGSDEETAKNALGVVAETLCKSFLHDKVVSINAQGSAWNEGGKAHAQHCKFEFLTVGDFVE